jgi:acetamidase/formamidase
LQDPLPEIVWIWQLDRDRDVARFESRFGDWAVDVPMSPMHGTVGVAPPNLEVRSALVPDVFGGNMDTPLMTAGTTCYLGVNVEGALLSIGDGHARQGEGETCGVAAECAMDTTIVVELIKGQPCPTPRLETDTHLVSLGSARPLEDAFRVAAQDLVTWVSAAHRMHQMDAYQLLSQVIEAPLANVVDTNYTSVAKVAKAFLPTATVYDDAHRRLRSAAATYLAGR